MKWHPAPHNLRAGAFVRSRTAFVCHRPGQVAHEPEARFYRVPERGRNAAAGIRRTE
ncbi:hypothetical protein GCM10027416_07780 [Okibacterium endophyticum]